MELARHYKPQISYKLKELPIKYITVWREAQARKLDRENIADLAKSIRTDGLQNPPLVQKVSNVEYLLLAGQRRLAAMKRLGAKTIPCNVILKKDALTLEQAKASSVVENIHRNKMDDADIVQAAIYLNEKVGKKEAAKMLGMSIQTLRSYLGYAAVPDALKEMVPEFLGRNDMTRLYIAIPNTNKAAAIAEKISSLDGILKRQYIRVLAKNPNGQHQKILDAAKASMLRQKITIILPKNASKRLSKLAEQNNTTHEKMASQLLKDNLR